MEESTPSPTNITPVNSSSPPRSRYQYPTMPPPSTTNTNPTNNPYHQPTSLQPSLQPTPYQNYALSPNPNPNKPTPPVSQPPGQPVTVVPPVIYSPPPQPQPPYNPYPTKPSQHQQPPPPPSSTASLNSASTAVVTTTTASYPGSPSPIQSLPPSSSPTNNNNNNSSHPHHPPPRSASVNTNLNTVNTNPSAVASAAASAAAAAASTKSSFKIMPQPVGGLQIRSLDEEADDGRVRNKEAVKKIQDDWFCKQIWARAKEFTRYNQARILLGTWNVNAKGKDENLDSWLCADWGPPPKHQTHHYPPSSGERNPSPDLIAVGLQEMVDLNAVNVALDNKAHQRSAHWIERIRHTLNSRAYDDPAADGYTLLTNKHLVGLLLCVFVKNRHRGRVRHVHSDSVGVGVMGMMGNKGGVSIRLQYYDSTICIVNSHLAAHRENIQGRNADFRNVYGKMNFRIGVEAVAELVRDGSLPRWGNGGGGVGEEEDGGVGGQSAIGIADHDLSFWIGDLNYRVGECVSTEDVLQLAKVGKLDLLRKNDQLSTERRAGRVFPGFEEGRLEFRPTYKYQPGTDLYDERPDKKLRAPAWCDRILWRSLVPSHVRQVNYRRSELNVSDHKPVMSSFVITVKDVIEAEREKVHADVNRILDRFDNKNLPMVGLSRSSLDFGEVRYGQRITLPIEITNTGKVVAQFRFIPKLNQTRICSGWMKIHPAYGMLIPGQASETISFTLTVDNAMAAALNTGQEVLEDIIILRLENGRDYYITITGRYARSCFGMSLDDLVLYSDPIRNVPLDPVKCVEKYGHDRTAKFCIPKELFRLVDAIYQMGLDTPDLFSIAGHAEEMDHIRECLDTGERFREDTRIHSYADVLIQFLANLSQTIVPKRLFPSLEIDEQNLQFYTRKFLDELPPIHYNVFVYVTSFLRECLLRQSKDSGLLPAKLARICCNCMVEGSSGGGGGSGEDVAKSTSRRRGMEDIMMHFLETSSI